MTDIKYYDPQKYRYCDRPRPGPIFRLQDIPQLVRGPTLVMLLPVERRSKCPEWHETTLQLLQMCILPQKATQNCKNCSSTSWENRVRVPPQLQNGRAPAFQRANEHPLQNPTLARHMGMNLAF